MYYHKKIMAMLDVIKEKAGDNVRDYYFDFRYETKKQYETIRRDYPELF